MPGGDPLPAAKQVRQAARPTEVTRVLDSADVQLHSDDGGVVLPRTATAGVHAANRVRSTFATSDRALWILRAQILGGLGTAQAFAGSSSAQDIVLNSVASNGAVALRTPRPSRAVEDARGSHAWPVESRRAVGFVRLSASSNACVCVHLQSPAYTRPSFLQPCACRYMNWTTCCTRRSSPRERAKRSSRSRR
jgi:hypothetical protein